ncbi:hypothetical protein SASPL_143027 [Salvia splendens]|uniref:Zinc finger PHD-type domain-containing protein n=1 Tax=Salvia splendens TaxID=180675 RepID=A0A8X8WK55_SALSN|nr:uncharacterized protein LOC121771518 isoform X2 [Salvia splendens]KAG6396870.1 hypothetical protein SASPL_143027 [Salvia splendens]
MRSRSHRLPAAEPRHDDWVDGSWTVDCVCGVTFDDGEEMVDCDECGVWVHTRCSRYVKSEKSFACDKCKSKNSGVRNESEETEVAEFLLELPTKTLTMENLNPPPVASRRPFRLWTDIPMEERVHVQGVPGGEPASFSGIGMSSVFGPQLWKSTGYVPKKFNLRYTEFPLLSQGKVEEKEDEDMDTTNGEKNANRTDNGARVLFSLLKKHDGASPATLVDSVNSKGVVERGACPERVAPRQKKKSDGDKPHFAPDDGIKKKKKNSVTVVLNSGKCKKEDLGASKDLNVRKKVRATDKESDVKKRPVHGSKAGDGKRLGLSQGKGCKADSDDLQCGKVLGDQPLDPLRECATNLASNEHGQEVTARNDVSNGEMLRVGNKEAQVPLESVNVFKTCNGVESLTEANSPQRLLVKEEVTVSVRTGSFEKELVAAAHVRITVADAKKSDQSQDLVIDETNPRPIKKLRSKLDSDNHGDHLVDSLHLSEVKLDEPKASTQFPGLSVNVVTGEDKVVGMSTLKTEANVAKVLEASRSLTVGCPRTDKPDESAGVIPHSKREHSGPEVSRGGRKKSSGLKPSSEVAEELLKSNGTSRCHSTASYQRKSGVTVLRSTSSSGIRSKSSENYMAATAQKSSVHSRQELSDSSQGTMKDNAFADKVERVDTSGRPKKLVKESSGSGSATKMSESNNFSNSSASKKPSSDLKDPSIHFSRVPLGSNVASSHVTGECTSPPSAEGSSSKALASAVPGKGEKSYHTGCNPPSKGHVASMTSPASSNVPAILSDEELALLLHHELNSSPRVPRVPRMRNAGSLPQLTGPTATSVLMKRTVSGGKDQGMVSRRRTKDFSVDGSHAPPKVDNEAKKMERKLTSPDNRRQDSSYGVEQVLSKEADGGLVKSVQSMKKKNMNSSISSSVYANEHNISSSRLSSRSAAADDPRMVGRQTNLTLPGLIAEIMSEGKRMTYDELCNAVLPHWPHLRKHNGDRYAYSSHSQAVLDCLRNRSEWACLVDRGPKTNGSRKRRKLDTDSLSIESEDNEDQRVKDSKDAGSKSFESHQGKRKARKRGRLGLQGRRIVRGRRRAGFVSDDESESFSYSSEDSMSSEEEIQGGGTSGVGSEVSASSDEVQ